ncbi:30S ribosomal protein S11 [Candidatus Jorgensenbacteria bacterium RIFCSPLOWO2_01_FULL_45_25b]|uniref:Small ribosomal subunit protein uS11 n=1 Tax=Candidatus Jorgensenbacteria bacterium RIFCSPLOWO2_01_FULL_45_25b TaxID=1798471 RepID=A0A1F6BT55_9BACT|nr:MAG: 30S ribosomal protein S11 [Candidatus Jorgensenbacteria bacterium RIFCSPLOWO2_01_FULL_45_25b]
MTAEKEKQSGKRKHDRGKIYVQATYNNTMMTVTDEKGNVVTWMSAGSLGFSGPKKATPFAASKVAEAIAEKTQKTGPINVEVYVKGVGSGRDSAIRALASKGFQISLLKDITPIPHNGPRQKKPRRV